jgi:hypothetical protein
MVPIIGQRVERALLNAVVNSPMLGIEPRHPARSPLLY